MFKNIEAIEAKIDDTMEAIEKHYNQAFDCNRVFPVSEKTFGFCLGAIAATRVVPGIPQNMGFERLYHCPDEASKQAVMKYLVSNFQVYDFKSLLAAGNSLFVCGVHYDLFLPFWHGEKSEKDFEALPCEDIEMLKKSRAFAKLFEPYLNNRGMYAFDYNERVVLCRLACACGMINEAQYNALIGEIIDKAVYKYHDWKEYAYSCVAGAAYFMYQVTGKIEDALHFMEYSRDIIIHVIAEDRVWVDAKWPEIKKVA